MKGSFTANHARFKKHIFSCFFSKVELSGLARRCILC
jgi:hypothetical protein